ncbi:MAG: hypothetical protein IJJ52_03770 [Lachnospiraceae bacterium]|nr:hypothetical protein [Lachnospiraceae bacterium]
MNEEVTDSDEESGRSDIDSSDPASSDAALSDEELTAAEGNPDYPAQSFSAAAESVVVSVESPAGALPFGTKMTVTEIDDEDTIDMIREAVDEPEKVAGVQAVDIKFENTQGEEIEPLLPLHVVLTAAAPESVSEEAGDPVVVHLDDEGNAAALEDTVVKEGDPASLVMPSENTGEEDGGSPDEETVNDHSENAVVKEVSFDTPSFSVYALVYTVDFEYSVNGKVYRFSIPGGGFVTFSQLADLLGLTRDPDAKSVENGEEAESAETEPAEEKSVEAETADAEAVEAETADAEAVKAEAVEADAPEAEEADAVRTLAVSDEARKFAADVASVEFSSPDLVWVGRIDEETTVGALKETHGLKCEYSAKLTEEQLEEIDGTAVGFGDWALISMHPFNTEESLTVTMKDGEVFTIRVTDAQISTQYLSSKGRLYEVTVAYGEDAKIPEGASLQVTEYSKYAEEYQYVRETVLGDGNSVPSGDTEETAAAAEETAVTAEETSSEAGEKAAESEEADAVSTIREVALEALDITILDQNGEPIEPEAPVDVRIFMKKLPDDLALFEETVAVRHLNTSSGEVQVETVADTDGIGGIYVSDQTAEADFTLDSFSQFAITYYQDNPRVVVNVHYVDINGTELGGTTTNVTATRDQSIDLSTYQNRMSQSGYTYLGAHYGTHSGQVITSLKGTTSSTGSLSASSYIVEFRNGNDVVARQEYQGELRQMDVYLVYAPSEGYYIQDTIGEDGCLTVKNGTEVVQTGTDQNLFVKWYRSSSASSGFQEVTQSKILNGSYNIPVLGGPKVNVSIDEGADQYYKAEIYKVEDNHEVVLSTTSVYHVPYYDDVRNGGFETPHNNGTTDESVHRWPSNWQVENGKSGVVWKTTGTATDGSKRDIEIPQGAAADGTGANNLGETLRNYCFAFMPEGNQCAELNCEASGALYQDVLTIPGSQIYWSLYHRARGGYDKWKTKTDKTQNRETDTMYVVAMSKELAEKYDVTTQQKVLSILDHVNNHDHEFYDVELVKITTTNGGNGTMEFMNSDYTMTVPPTYFGNLADGRTKTVYDSGTRLTFTYGNTDWHYYTGNFSIPADQYLTRFFFVAGDTASGNPTMGNFLDDIKLSDSVPAPNHGQATAIIQKTVEGLDNLPSNYATRIEAAYQVTKFDGTTESTDRSSDYDHYRTQIDESGKAVSTASWTFPITIAPGSRGVFTSGQEVSPQTAGKTDRIAGYEQTTAWRISKRSADGETETVIASGTGKTIPKAEMEKLTITERDIVCIEFINSYRKMQPASVWKTDINSRSITSGAEFELYKADEFDVNTNKPKEGAVKVISGTTGKNGILFLGQLSQGEYRLLETKAPEGFILPEAAIKITVTDSKVTAMQGSRISDAVTKEHENWVEGQAEDTKQIQVWNNPGVELPATGGPGTAQIYLLGFILAGFAGAGLLMERRKRKAV